MTTPAGTIGMSDVNIELSKTSTALVTLNDGDVRTLAAVPSGIISMDDLRNKSAINYGTLTSNFSVRSEGEVFTFTLNGIGVPDGTYYWRIDYLSNLTAADFSASSGAFTVTSNVGNFTVTTVNDALDEGNGTFRAVMGETSGVPIVRVGSSTCTVTETTTYTATSDKTSCFRIGSTADERLVVHYIYTTQVTVGTWIWAKIISVSGGITFSPTSNYDISSAQLESFQITGTLASGVGQRNVVSNLFLNGQVVSAKTYRVEYYTDAGLTNLVATGPIITIKAAPTYGLSFSPTTINEGATGTGTITTTNLPYPWTVYYQVTGTAFPTTDILYGAASGTIVLSGTTATFPVTAAYDGGTEGTESSIYSYNNLGGATVATATFYIAQFLGTYSLTISKTGGLTANSAVTVSGRITGASSYPEARSFAITYSVNGGARTTSGMVTTTITVPANSTSSSTTLLYNTPGPGLVTSLNIQATRSGHNTVTSANISGFYVG